MGKLSCFFSPVSLSGSGTRAVHPGGPWAGMHQPVHTTARLVLAGPRVEVISLGHSDILGGYEGQTSPSNPGYVTSMSSLGATAVTAQPSSSTETKSSSTMCSKTNVLLLGKLLKTNGV